ncbi:unnamed protein product [Cylicocyclus nassatus]|uniref:Uncharacterized protein n=1 Tax=Cylicocyclus nassatus TaxID=53992 RepID=A0AA36H2T2_CYLNA|nr:unnamed protein product [Cylicocyclus nassatus]
MAKYAEAGAKEPEIRIKKAKIEIDGLGTFDDCSIVKTKVGFSRLDGAPFEELLDFKLQKEYKEGTMHIGEIQLPGLENKENQAPGPSYSEAANCIHA